MKKKQMEAITSWESESVKLWVKVLILAVLLVPFCKKQAIADDPLLNGDFEASTSSAESGVAKCYFCECKQGKATRGGTHTVRYGPNYVITNEAAALEACKLYVDGKNDSGKWRSECSPIRETWDEYAKVCYSAECKKDAPRCAVSYKANPDRQDGTNTCDSTAEDPTASSMNDRCGKACVEGGGLVGDDHCGDCSHHECKGRAKDSYIGTGLTRKQCRASGDLCHEEQNCGLNCDLYNDPT